MGPAIQAEARITHSHNGKEIMRAQAKKRRVLVKSLSSKLKPRDIAKKLARPLKTIEADLRWIRGRRRRANRLGTEHTVIRKVKLPAGSGTKLYMGDGGTPEKFTEIKGVKDLKPVLKVGL
jgi:hypothetical protein